LIECDVVTADVVVGVVFCVAGDGADDDTTGAASGCAEATGVGNTVEVCCCVGIGCSVWTGVTVVA